MVSDSADDEMVNSPPPVTTMTCHSSLMVVGKKDTRRLLLEQRQKTCDQELALSRSGPFSSVPKKTWFRLESMWCSHRGTNLHDVGRRTYALLTDCLAHDISKLPLPTSICIAGTSRVSSTVYA